MLEKYVNENFFDEESKAMWYILGISFAQYTQYELKLNRWSSANKNLVELVKSSIDSERTISYHEGSLFEEGKKYGEHLLQINNQFIYNALNDRGLSVPKLERTFPEDIEEQYLNHFVRGFFDAQVSCVNYTQHIKRKGEIYDHHTQQLQIYFNVSFLKDIYNVLVEHANVRSGKEVSKYRLNLVGTDATAVYGFLYRDWDFIQESGLYLPSKKARFEVGLDFENQQHLSPVNVQNRIDDAKKLLLKGMSRSEIANTLGYSTLSGYNQAFKNATGQTPGQFLKESK